MNQKAIALLLVLSAAGVVNAKEMVVRIGHAGPLTGAIAHQGKDNENGARLAIEEANARGTVIGGNKVVFELLGEDDQADPRQATTVAQRFVDAGVKGVVGHLNSGASIPASRVYENAGLPAITPSSTNPKLTRQGFKTAFRVIANDVTQGAVLGGFLVKDLRAAKVAIIDDRTAYGQGLADEVERAVKAAGGKVSGREFTTDKATDFMAILTKIKGAQPDAIFFGGMDAQVGPMLRQVKQLGMNVKFVTGDGGCTTEVIKLAGDAMGPHTYCSQAGVPLDKMAAGVAFKARYKTRFHSEVQSYAPYAYDATMALIEAMKQSGSAEPAKYLPALKHIAYPGLTGKIAFDSQGDLKEGAITLYSYKSGQWEAQGIHAQR